MNFSKISLKELACFVYQTLKNHGIDAILVGGACVSIYSENCYESMDVDFATYVELKPIEEVLGKYGFKRIGRCFTHPKCPYVVDFVNPPVTVGHEAICEFNTLESSSGMLQLLSPTDCVKDRLASFFHWNDKQALDQALLVAKEHAIDIKNLKRWAKAEGHGEKLKQFLEKLK